MGKVIMTGIVNPLIAPVNLPPVGTPLEDLTWEQIRDISDAGVAADYFSVGDTKAITVRGTVGTLSVNATYYVYIIGIDHNESIEGRGITFGTFKTAASGGVDVALTDSKYGNTDYSSGAKYFNMNHWVAYNYGGWKGCDLRYDILGSTNVAPSSYGASSPSTSRAGSDASETCATNPVANTLMAALPADLRAVMKPMTIYTDNVSAAGDSYTAAEVTASVDYLPLLSQFEVLGKTEQANSYEKNKQAQYDYYKAGNSKVKNKHNATSTKINWQLRSPSYYGYGAFCIVYTDGTYATSSGGQPRAIAPIFRV